ncbi:MAG TPA: ABC transporter substrate-binding protein, partial [Thermoplasmata archaeon]|nr:ABC transporter substrate-binding protein [Thermoplasmata archaeon]
MIPKLLRSKHVHAVLIVYVMVAAGLLFVLLAHPAAAVAGSKDTLTVGLQNDMVNPNYFDTATNSVWKQYHVEFNFEGLFSHDPDFTTFNVLSDPARGGSACPAGSLPSGPGYCIDSTGFGVTVYLRNNATFTNGQTLTANDVVFTFQTLPWSTYQLGIFNSIWSDTKTYPLWNATTCGSSPKCVSHIGVEKIDATTVKFHLAKTYALFFYDTMETPIIPSGLWTNHMGTWPQLNLSNPAARLTDTYDNSIDLTYNGLDAATGSGPFMLTSWTHNADAMIDVSPSYWGKGQTHTWRGDAYPFYPKALRHIRAVIYGSLDVISLALQRGDIDTLVWPLTPGFLSQVQSNPAINIEQVTDSGFFYVSFNMRERPWGQAPWSQTLRKAFSQAIDKDYIVNTLMGGFGVKGTVPIAISNPLYVNTTATPPGFDINAGHAALLAAGFHDCNGDGFLEAPDCSPVKATILTPPKDYDPIRADAGIMISKNLKTMGLDIDAAPTSFDTIVAKAFSAPVSFDVYVLGFSLGDFPETYICDFFCTSRDVNLGTGGSNSAGYSNSSVDSLINSALTDTDTASRVQKIKDVEGILTDQLPWNVLYYRKNLNAYRNDAWTGWANYPNGGGIYNPWSIPHIVPAGTVTPPTGGSLTVALSMPDQVYARQVAPFDILVSQGTAPASGAAVTLTLRYGSQTITQSGTTDAGGRVHFTWTVPVIQGNVIVSVVATKGTLSGTNGKVMEVTVAPPAPISTLSLSTPTPVIAPSGTATITARLVDATGAGLVGYTVNIDTTLVFGAISPASGVTDATGRTAFTYTPPAAGVYTNQHLTEVIKANVTVPNTIVATTQKASMILFVQNDVTPNWLTVSAASTSANGLVVNPVISQANFTVTVSSWSGAAVAGIDVDPQVSDTGNLTVAATSAGSNRTDASGHATFTATETASARAAGHNVNVGLRFVARNQVFSTSDELEVLVSTGLTTAGHAAWITFDARAMAFDPTGATNNVTAHVVDQTGAAANGVPVFFQITYGDLGLPAEFDWSYHYGCSTTCGADPPNYQGTGLDLNSFGMGSLGGSFANSPVIGDPTVGTKWGVTNFVEDFEVVGNLGVVDSCDSTTWPTGFSGLYTINATSLTGAGTAPPGTVKVHFTAMPHKIDSRVQVKAYIGGTPDISADACNFVASAEKYAFAIDSGVVIQRAPVFGLASVTLSAPIFTSQALGMTIHALFKGLNGATVPDPEVFLVQGPGPWCGRCTSARNVKGTFGGTITGTSLGYVNYTRTETLVSLSQSFPLSFIPNDFRYAFGGTDEMFSGAYGKYWISPNFAAPLAKIPFDFTIGYLYLPTTRAFLTVSLDRTLLAPGGTATATVQVWSILTGGPIAGANVWSGSSQVTTDSTGTATFNVTAATLGATEGLVVATTSYGGAARGWFGYVASPPVVTYGTPTVTAAEVGSASTITATVTNTLAVAGSAPVTLYVDGAAVAVQTVNLTSLGT